MTGDIRNDGLLICKMCRKKYRSRGINEPGYCKECEQAITEAKSMQPGGPLFSQKIGEKR